MCLRFSRFNIDIYLPLLQFIWWHSNSFAIKLLSLGLRLHSDIWMALQRNHIRICGHSLVISVNSTTKITWRISIIDLSSTCLIRDISRGVIYLIQTTKPTSPRNFIHNRNSNKKEEKKSNVNGKSQSDNRLESCSKRFVMASSKHSNSDWNYVEKHFFHSRLQSIVCSNIVQVKKIKCENRANAGLPLLFTTTIAIDTLCVCVCTMFLYGSYKTATLCQSFLVPSQIFAMSCSYKSYKIDLTSNCDKSSVQNERTKCWMENSAMS